MSKKAELVKPNNRRASHSQNPQSLKTKRKGGGKGGWGDPMDDLKYLNNPIHDHDDPNYEEEEPELELTAEIEVVNNEAYPSEAALSDGNYFQNFHSDVEV